MTMTPERMRRAVRREMHAWPAPSPTASAKAWADWGGRVAVSIASELDIPYELAHDLLTQELDRLKPPERPGDVVPFLPRTD